MKRRHWVSVGFGCVAAVLAVVGVGGAFRWVQAGVALLLAVAVAAEIPSRSRLVRFSPLLLVPATAAILTAVSLLPLPYAVRNALDPVGESYRADGVALLNLSPWPALTRDVPGSLSALAFFVILLGVVALALRTAASERGRYRLMTLAGCLCGVAALITVIHLLVGATSLYGVYHPHASPSILGPLLNENHLGALMALGTCVSGGLLMYRRHSAARRAAWALMLLLCAALTALSHSRGALLALLSGMFVLAAVLIGQRFAPTSGRRRRLFATSSLPIAIVGLCIVVLVIYSSAAKVGAELGRTSLDEITQPRSKFAAWKSAEILVRESPWVGVGRGGFEASFTRVYPASGFVTFGFVENEYIQAFVDWGVVGGVLLGLTVLWLAGTAIRRWRDGPLVAGALGALTAVAAQSNVDYGVELLGLAVPVTIVAATLAYVPLQRSSDARQLTTARCLRVALALGLLASAWALSSDRTSGLNEDHALLASKPTPAHVREVLNRHPLDYLGYAVAAEQTSGTASVELLNNALRLHPTHPGLHRKAAQLLVRAGYREQAAIEYAFALRTSSHPEALLAEVTKTFTPTLAATAIPVDVSSVDPILRALRELQHDDVATLWLRRVLVVKPHDIHICNTLYDLSLSNGDLAAAEDAGRSCVELQPDRQTRMALANVLMQRNGYAEVVRLLSDVDTWQGLASERGAAWMQLCDADIALERWDDAASCLHRLDTAGDLPADRHEEITKRLEMVLDHRTDGSHQPADTTKPATTNRDGGLR